MTNHLFGETRNDHVAYLYGSSAQNEHRVTRLEPVERRQAFLQDLLMSRLAAARPLTKCPLVFHLEVAGPSGEDDSWPPFELLAAAHALDPQPYDRSIPYMLVTSTRRRRALTFVVYDWQSLEFPIEPLQRLGCHTDELVRLLYDGGSVERGGVRRRRWGVERKTALGEEFLNISLGSYVDDIQPAVGRFSIGEVSWSRIGEKNGTVRVPVEVICLPRFSARRPGPRRLPCVALSEKQQENLDFVNRAVRIEGAADGLIGMLRLASDPAVHLGKEPVWLSTSRDPSPLAFLPLERALIVAAEEQRRQYIRRREVVRTPTGTIAVGAYMSNLARRMPERVPVDRFTLSYDTPENRLFRAVAERVGRILSQSRGALTRRLAGSFQRVESTFGRAQRVAPSLSLAKQLQQRPLPEAQKRAVELCCAAIEGRYPGLEPLAESFGRAASFELDVAELFEAAALGACQRALVGTRISVNDGNHETPETRLQWQDTNNLEAFKRSEKGVVLKPDLCFVRGDNVVAVGDAKYKALSSPNTGPNTTHAPLRREDLFQILAYMQAWPQARFGLMILPWNDNDTASATRCISTLQLPDSREVAIFQLDPERWQDRQENTEPLAQFLRNAVRHSMRQTI